MEDANLIAYLFPAGDPDDPLSGYGFRAVCMSENRSRYFRPQQEASQEQEGRSRELTALLDEKNENQTPNYLFKPGLQLTFKPGPRAGPGYVLGTDRNSCDIVLPNLVGISRRHCSLTFDAQRRLILRDFSHNGTIVTYDGKGREKRRHFKWILGGDGIPKKTKNLVIEIHAHLKFQIVVFCHETYPDIYVKNVDQFLQEAAADVELPIGALGIQSASSTVHQSGERTPLQDPLYVPQGTLGKGSFSVVKRVWDVSTGHSYASKEFRNVKRSNWRREADIMLQISHEHILELALVIEKPSPRLILEYLPLGSLEDQHRQQQISDDETLTVLCQSLNALTYLHEEGIVHRDIKPQNILVQSRISLHVKLADFGLSKANSDLRTECGTWLYAAPEVFQSSKYTNACDIWSVGVVVFQYVYGLPDSTQDRGRRWCKRIINVLNDWDSDALIDFLLTAMLVMEPGSRLSAEDCYMEALRLLAPTEGRCLTPTPSSHVEEFQATAVYHPTEIQEIKGQRHLPTSLNESLGYKAPNRSKALVPDCRTAFRQEHSTNPFPSSEIRKYIRSDFRPPDSEASTFVEKRKRSTRPSASSSASARRGNKRRGTKAVVSGSGSCLQKKS